MYFESTGIKILRGQSSLAIVVWMKKRITTRNVTGVIVRYS